MIGGRTGKERHPPGNLAMHNENSIEPQIALSVTPGNLDNQKRFSNGFSARGTTDKREMQ
jgi:hypothetical protein